MEEKWTTEIKSKYEWYHLNLGEVFRYRDLIWMFVKRNYSTRFKQTILGPAWLIISPLFTIITYTLVFGGIAGLSTDGVPKPIFYLTGNIMWTFFANNINVNANTFIANANIFGKVYFPRLVTPISSIITNFFDFLIQFGLLMVFMVYYLLRGELDIQISKELLYIPLVLLQVAILGMGLGIIISSLTTRYRDLRILIGFGLQIWMYGSPVIYSVTLVPEKLKNIFYLNPMTSIILIFKKALLGIGEIPYGYWGISWLMTIIAMAIGVVIFNQVEKTFMDTI